MNVNEMLKAYVDGELTPQERSSVEDAAAKDPEIKSQIEWLQATSFTLRAATPQFEIKGKAETLAALKKPAPRRAAQWWMGGLTIAGTAAIAVVAVVKLQGNGTVSNSLVAMKDSIASAASPVAPATSGIASEGAKSGARPVAGLDRFDAKPIELRSSPNPVTATTQSKVASRPERATGDANQDRSSKQRQLVAPVLDETEVITVEVDDVELSENNIAEAMKKAGFSVQKPGANADTVVLVVPSDRIAEAKALLASSSRMKPLSADADLQNPPRGLGGAGGFAGGRGSNAGGKAAFGGPGGAGASTGGTKSSPALPPLGSAGFGGGKGSPTGLGSEGRAGRAAESSNQSRDTKAKTSGGVTESLGFDAPKAEKEPTRATKEIAPASTPVKSKLSSAAPKGSAPSDAKVTVKQKPSTVLDRSQVKNEKASTRDEPIPVKRKLLIIKLKAKPKASPVQSKGDQSL